MKTPNQLYYAAIGLGMCVEVIGLASSSAAGLEVAIRAKAANLITLRLQTRHVVSDFQLEVSFDGETYHNCSAGLPRPWNLFYSISQTEREATIAVAVIAGFAGGLEQFLFEEPGQKWFRWQIRYEGGIAPDTLEQTVTVLPPSQEDLHFLGGLANPELIRAMFGADFFERQTGDAAEHFADLEPRAIKVIGELLRVTRESDPTRVHLPQGDLRKAADLLWQLAQDIPDSSYAPYAAYFAGCCYLADVFEHMERFMRRNDPGKDEIAPEELPAFRRRAQELQTFPLAGEALAFAAAHGDAYLKPLAMYMQAGHAIGGGLFEEAERKLAEAEAAMPGTGAIEKWAAETRKGLKRLYPEAREPATDRP